MSTTVRDAKFLVSAKARCGTRPFDPAVAGPIDFTTKQCELAAQSLARKGLLMRLSEREYQVVSCR